jgi:hypothetical protein
VTHCTALPAVIGHHQQMIAAVFGHRVAERGMAARIFGVGETRVFLLRDHQQARLQMEWIIAHVLT